MKKPITKYCFIVVIYFLPFNIYSQSLVNKFPSVATIKQKITNPDNYIQACMQNSAIFELSSDLPDVALAEGRKANDPQVVALLNAYNAAGIALRKQIYSGDPSKVKGITKEEVYRFLFTPQEIQEIKDDRNKLATMRDEQLLKQKRDEPISAEERELTMIRLELCGGGLLVLFIGIFLITSGLRSVRELRKYEFENTTDGGVVQFDSYEESRRHNMKILKARYRLYLSSIFLVGGIAMIIGGFYFR